MPDRLQYDGIELAAIRELFRQSYRRWGLGTYEQAGKRLKELNPLVNAEHAASWLEGHTISRTEIPIIADAMLTIIAEHKDEVLQQLQGNSHAAIMADVLTRHRPIPMTPLPALDSSGRSRGYASTIFANWNQPVARGAAIIVPGLYQLFRLYKPSRELTVIDRGIEEDKPHGSSDTTGAPIGSFGGVDLSDHVVICELFYVDPDKLECILVTCEGNTYIGTLHINHEEILFGILQRKPVNRLGVNQRFLCMQLARSKLPYYSGLMIKVGDQTQRPISSECLLVRIARRLPEHADLYEAFEQLRTNVHDVRRIDENSVIARYLTSPPPVSPYDSTAPEWKRVKFVRDFPALLNLTTMRGKDQNKFRLLREPSRTLHHDTTTVLGRKSGMQLPVFRHESP